jgi:hypothetical protein
VVSRDAVVSCLDDWAPDRRSGLLAFVKAYIDRGQRPDADGIMSIGCAVFSASPYKQFVKGWKVLLRELGGVPYIHSTDFYGGGSIYRSIPKQLRAGVAAQIPGAIRSHVKAHMVVSFKAKEFNVVAGPEWTARFGSLYTTAVQIAMGAVGHWCNEINYSGRISYFYESGDREQGELAKRLAELPPHVRAHFRMLTAAPMDKGDAHGLEVADVLSWHWNKLYAETLARAGLPLTGDKAKDMRIPRGDTAALFDDGVGEKPRVFLFSGGELEYSLRRLWDPSLPAREDFMRPSKFNGIRDEILRLSRVTH